MSGLNPNLPGLGPGFGRDRSRSILMMNSKYDEDNEEDVDSPVQVVKLGYTHFPAVLIIFRTTVYTLNLAGTQGKNWHSSKTRKCRK